jgi:RimJ/RimL family protein N-acetyltransferase
MYELAPDHFIEALPLFAGVAHSKAIVLAVFEGYHVGRVWVDRRERPRAALLGTASGFSYAAGDPAAWGDPARLREVILRELTADGALSLSLLTPAWEPVLQEIGGALPLVQVPRQEFDLDEERFAQLMREGTALPPGFELRRYDRAAAAEVPELVRFWGDLDRFMARGIGFGVWHQGHAVSRCHAVLMGGGRVEISVDTDEAYRRRGLALAACGAFVAHCLSRGLEPVWTCWPDREASMALARRLGFAWARQAPVWYAEVGRP